MFGRDERARVVCVCVCELWLARRPKWAPMLGGVGSQAAPCAPKGGAGSLSVCVCVCVTTQSARVTQTMGRIIIVLGGGSGGSHGSQCCRIRPVWRLLLDSRPMRGGPGCARAALIWLAPYAFKALPRAVWDHVGLWSAREAHHRARRRHQQPWRLACLAAVSGLSLIEFVGAARARRHTNAKVVVKAQTD
jgi:hypothetical protein